MGGRGGSESLPNSSRCSANGGHRRSFARLFSGPGRNGATPLLRAAACPPSPVALRSRAVEPVHDQPVSESWHLSLHHERPNATGNLGSSPRFMICVTHFYTLRESKNTETCENRTRNACKNVRQNLILRATAYGILTFSLPPSLPPLFPPSLLSLSSVGRVSGARVAGSQNVTNPAGSLFATKMTG